MLNLEIQNGNDNSLKNDYDVIILGAGPAGMTAGIYAGRSLLDTLIIENKVVGGEASSTNLIENYPGYPDGISGMELTENMKNQAEKYGAHILVSPLKEVELNGKSKSVTTEDGTFHSKTIIIATGTAPKKIGVPGEDEFKGRGISYCATCDAPFFKDEHIAVIGAGNSGIQESLYLLNFVKSITIVEFLDHMTAEKILQERIKKKENVEILLNHKVTSINGNQTVNSIDIENRNSGKIKNMEVAGIFIYVGLEPNTKFLKGELNLNKQGFIKTDENLKTSKEGVLAAGDVIEKSLRQVATAVGDGALAAFSAKTYIENKMS
jgi:thioredoxin reductase (NADPH)